MRARLVLAIVTTTLEAIAMAALAIFVLPRFDVRIPVPLVAAIIAGWVGWSIFTHRKGTQALLRKPIGNMVDMTGCTGKVAKALHPGGLVKINGELWAATAVDRRRIGVGAVVVVVGREGLRLLVRSDDPGSFEGSPVEDRDHDQSDTNNRQG